MASSNFTTRLGLCSWAASDRPKRADFVSDNNIIDNLLGGHINNTALHMSAAEKDKAIYPFENVVYSGSGDATRNISIGYRPTAVIVFKKNSPTGEYDDGVNIINSAVAAYGVGASSGISINSDGITVQQESAASNGKRISLNEQGCQYGVIAFK